MTSLTDALVKQLLAERYIASLAAFDDVTMPITPESVIAWDIREGDGPPVFRWRDPGEPERTGYQLEPCGVPTVVPDARMRGGHQTSELGPRTSDLYG